MTYNFWNFFYNFFFIIRKKNIEHGVFNRYFQTVFKLLSMELVLIEFLKMTNSYVWQYLNTIQKFNWTTMMENPKISFPVDLGQSCIWKSKRRMRSGRWYIFIFLHNYQVHWDIFIQQDKFQEAFQDKLRSLHMEETFNSLSVCKALMFSGMTVCIFLSGMTSVSTYLVLIL